MGHPLHSLQRTSKTPLSHPHKHSTATEIGLLVKLLGHILWGFRPWWNSVATKVTWLLPILLFSAICHVDISPFTHNKQHNRNQSLKWHYFFSEPFVKWIVANIMAYVLILIMMIAYDCKQMCWILTPLIILYFSMLIVKRSNDLFTDFIQAMHDLCLCCLILACSFYLEHSGGFLRNMF